MSNFKGLYIIIVLVISIACTSNSKKAALSSAETQITSVISVDDLTPQISEKNFSTDTNALKLISWNIQDLGQSKNTEEIAFIVNVLKDFDLIAIQEVVAKHPAGAQKIAEIADELNRTGSKWDYRISDPTKSPSAYMSERYAYLWKTSNLEIVGRPYLDEDLAQVIIREPFIAKFKLKSNSSIFHIVNFHSRKYNENPELEIIHFQNYQERLKTDKLIIAGDFNLNEKHNVWDSFYARGFKSAVKDSKTTLKQKCSRGEYLYHAIDNIYFSNKVTHLNSSILDYVNKCENLKSARLISDHLPVYIEFSLEEN